MIQITTNTNTKHVALSISPPPDVVGGTDTMETIQVVTQSTRSNNNLVKPYLIQVEGVPEGIHRN